jgi:hypothetical protein
MFHVVKPLEGMTTQIPNVGLKSRSPVEFLPQAAFVFFLDAHLSSTII